MKAKESNSEEVCALCGAREKLTKHHLVPVVKCTKGNSKLKNEKGNFLMVCDLCHRTIHAYFTDNELKERLHTKESLMSEERFQKYLAWRRKHLNFQSNSTKLSNHAR